ncbi:GNAT family N-acetyltransferase [Dokdonella immobilis]|uniref:Acetyltransferase (GNAT) family protein n=1 Tax=Dokdonella immobilis TaxID=578942 RepID=A0A1I5ADM1_9GAMM|nr:GNAT family N-acetyltransferase [Dokdonella immobilis]SFN60556.1 Acetyltransferase (GNAT) family protein [Dokdonella immobilis]
MNRTEAASPSVRDSADPYCWRETLDNGTQITIRAIRTEDGPLEREFIAGLSPETRRMRFLGQIGEPSDDLIRSLTDLDFSHDMALIATVEQRGQTVEVGVSRYATGEDRSVGECAIVVADDWQHRGIGTLLMQRLIEVARGRGMKRLFSIDDSENARMRELAEELGFKRHFDPGNPHEVVHSLDLG